MKKVFFFLIFSAIVLTAQTDSNKWSKREVNYTLTAETNHRDYSVDFTSPFKAVIKSVATGYWVLISDLDGNNCPFRPSCSSFFIHAADSTNLLQGLLMFMDRFTRDLNIVNRHSHYPRLNSGYYYDPVNNYTLNKDNIKYIPPYEKVADK